MVELKKIGLKFIFCDDGKRYQDRNVKRLS